MKRLAKIALLLVAASFIGCATNTSGTVIEKGRLYVYNQRFASHLEMKYQLRRQTTTNFIHVQAFLQNADTSDFAFQYRFEWKDADGMVLPETNPSWKVATIHGRDTLALQGVSESPDAADFRLVVKPL